MASAVFGRRSTPAKLQPERLAELETSRRGGWATENDHGTASQRCRCAEPHCSPQPAHPKLNRSQETRMCPSCMFLWPSLFCMDFSILSIYFSNVAKPIHHLGKGTVVASVLGNVQTKSRFYVSKIIKANAGESRWDARVIR